MECKNKMKGWLKTLPLPKTNNKYMNRELKFRAWDIVGKRWWLPNTEYEADEGAEVFFAIEKWFIRFNRGYIALMQYTGLKDEDDKEIYEGDIIWQEIWNGGDGRTEPNETDRFEGIVIYDVNGFGIQTKGCENGETEVELVKNDEFNTSGVIGNIYENPELLK